MKKRQERSEVRVVQVAIICDVCGVESASAHGWRPDENSSYGLGGYTDLWSGESMHWACDLCPGCWVKVGNFVESLGGKVRNDDE